MKTNPKPRVNHFNVRDVAPVADGKSVDAVRSTLKGPVMRTLRGLMPELPSLSEDETYERVLNSLALLVRCFYVFRSERQRFAYVLVDAGGRAVGDDNTPLACGRTLEQVVAMIVRSAARRYFRRHVRGPEVNAVAPRDTTLLDRFRDWLPIGGERPKSASEALYDAIKAYLMYDWQVPLVPAYAQLTPAQVRRLGRRLLEIDDVKTLERAARQPRVPPPPMIMVTLPPTNPPTPSVLGGLRDSNGTRLRGSGFAAILMGPAVRAVLPGGLFSLHPTGILDSVDVGAAETLSQALDLNLDQLAVFLLAAYDRVGGQTFLRIFGTDADPQTLPRLIERARKARIGKASSLAIIADFVRKTFVASAKKD